LSEIRRLNWGCGTDAGPGWINSDIKEGPNIDLPCDIRDGLPLDDETIDYAVSVHALPEVPIEGQVAVLSELRRVLKRGGVLRLALPDLLKGVDAYRRGDRDFFLIPDEDALSLGAKLVTQLVWYGYSRTLFVPDFVEEIALAAGFREVRHVAFRQTTTEHAGITELDNREAESLFVEAFK